MPRQVALRVFLVLAMLLAQQAALAHQYWHASKAAVAADATTPAKGDGLCDLHDLLGTVLGVAAGAVPPVVFLAASESRSVAPAVAVHEAAALAAHSRDPPPVS